MRRADRVDRSTSAIPLWHLPCLTAGVRTAPVPVSLRAAPRRRGASAQVRWPSLSRQARRNAVGDTTWRGAARRRPGGAPAAALAAPLRQRIQPGRGYSPAVGPPARAPALPSSSPLAGDPAASRSLAGPTAREPSGSLSRQAASDSNRSSRSVGRRRRHHQRYRRCRSPRPEASRCKSSDHRRSCPDAATRDATASRLATPSGLPVPGPESGSWQDS